MNAHIRTINIQVNISKAQIKRNLDERTCIRGKYEARWSFKRQMWEIHCPIGRWSYIGVGNADLHKALTGLKKYMLDRYELKAIKNMALSVDDAEGFVIVTGGTSLSKMMKGRIGWALREATKIWRTVAEHTEYYFENEHKNNAHRLMSDLQLIALWKKGHRDIVVGTKSHIIISRRMN